MRSEFESNSDSRYCLDYIEEYVWRKYPRIESSEDFHLIDDFMNKRISKCSFNIYLDEEIREALLIKSLLRASDPSDPAFCIHGAEGHKENFNEVIMTLTQAVKDENYVLRSETLEQTSDGKGTASKFILETPGAKKRRDVPIAVFGDIRSVFREKMDPKLSWYDREKLLFDMFGNYCTTVVVTAYSKSTK